MQCKKPPLASGRDFTAISKIQGGLRKMTGHGGARPGAGRKKKDRSNQLFFETAEDYLLAVVQGRVIPDAVRVQAAKTLINYETPKKRAPVLSLPPEKLRQETAADVQESVTANFEKEAAKIREKFKGGKKNGNIDQTNAGIISQNFKKV